MKTDQKAVMDERIAARNEKAMAREIASLLISLKTERQKTNDNTDKIQ